MPHSLENYRRLHQDVRNKLGLKTPIRIVASQAWFFDHRPGRKTIIIHAPPFHPDRTAPVFVHYLGHARLIQDGWPRMQATVMGTKEVRDYLMTLSADQRQNMPLYWASRSEDAFFDFYVWRHVISTLGIDWLERWLDVTSLPNLEALRAFFGKKRSVGTDLHRYVYCLDWFGSLAALAEEYDLPVRKKLKIQRKAVQKLACWSPAFRTAVRKNIPWLRDFYRNLCDDYPGHKVLLKKKKNFDSVFGRYYEKIWNDLPLEMTIKKSG